MQTPWGSAQHITTYEPGIVSVSTAGHGGFMAKKDWAEKNLTEAARNQGFFENGHYCYEEDCKWAIAAFEIPQHWPRIFEYMKDCDTPEQQRAYLIKTISAWDAQYLIDRGIEPEPAAYARYLERHQEDQMRADKSPDLIVIAWGDWDTQIPGICRVATADGAQHFVTEESYDRVTGLNLLSKCEIVSVDTSE